MSLLRRAAVRTLSQPATRQLSTFRSSAPRAQFQHLAYPSISIRSFHQSRIWRAEEEKQDAEAAAAVAEEAAEAAQEAAEEAVVESAATSSPEAEPAVKEAQEVAEGESSIAADAAATASAAASTAHSASSSSPFPPPAGSAAAAEAEQTSKIVYVGNLFFEVTTTQLEQEFGQFGRIINSRIATDARGLSKGFGYVEFSDAAAAKQAIEQLDQKVFQGRRMAVQHHKPRERKPSIRERTATAPSKTLFIGNMSYQMSDKDLNDLFREVRDVLDVRVAIDRRSGQPRGFAHADFVDVHSATVAKEQLASKMIYGRQLRVDYSSSSSNRSE